MNRFWRHVWDNLKQALIIVCFVFVGLSLAVFPAHLMLSYHWISETTAQVIATVILLVFFVLYPVFYLIWGYRILGWTITKIVTFYESDPESARESLKFYTIMDRWKRLMHEREQKLDWATRVFFMRPFVGLITKDLIIYRFGYERLKQIALADDADQHGSDNPDSNISPVL